MSDLPNTRMILTKLIDLSNPESSKTFFSAYGELLKVSTRIAGYRIVQSILALLPFAAGLGLALFLREAWTYVVATSIAALTLGLVTLFLSPRKSGHHAP
ncbi:hypothetical protein SH449x_002881 [Pirellulaceae bacterium SH449]